MAPDVEELIKRINTLTLDKNRLKQKLIQLTNGNQNVVLNNLITDQSSTHTHSNTENSLSERSNDLYVSNNNITSGFNSSSLKLNHTRPNIVDVGCATSCEEDILYINNIYKNQLEEYSKNWDFIQSKCTALLSELNALQKHYALLSREKLELEHQLKSKCDEYDKIDSELQTVVLNYETQLSAMSEHLSMLTSQVNLNEPTNSN